MPVMLAAGKLREENSDAWTTKWDPINTQRDRHRHTDTRMQKKIHAIIFFE